MSWLLLACWLLFLLSSCDKAPYLRAEKTKRWLGRTGIRLQVHAERCAPGKCFVLMHWY